MEEFYVLITASDSELKELSYLPLKSNHVYKATNSIYKDSNSLSITKSYYDVIVEDFGVVTGVHKKRLKVLTKQELRELNLNNLLSN